ncbi:class I SAM-dependent methyltransferase [Mycobacterium simiae]|uniref:class I SAM-dependent methyltransferase n=1 Tax=Mycobacterium simiae TaxID=1784 RepID=UPI0004122CDA|nr:class I SAM-dependent methyltransferase [Mycobacterium simiae]PLV52142.1 SAM-dependent methyltransferase [Mycobacterium tuberculosis variant microti OV254]BBX43870.1 methoxy mycolic acid synthase MmaA3 [Mycobacterium simiae]
MTQEMIPRVDDAQVRYDLSDDFFRLFLDRTQIYSCAYFERDDMTLEEAQLAKIDLALASLDLQPGMTLLDVDCGWGTTMRRAIEKYDVNVVGLTSSSDQAAYVQQSFDEMDTQRSKWVMLQGWEEFAEPVDRIVSIGAFEHGRYDDLFEMAYAVLPDDGVMFLHTITEVPTPAPVEQRAEQAGFTLTLRETLQPHYAKTLDLWTEALEAHKDEAIARHSEEVYQRYLHFLTGRANAFRTGQIDVTQVTLEKD